MLSKSLLASVLLVASAFGQSTTPPGFSPSTDSELGVFYGNSAISVTPGETPLASKVANQPKLAVQNGTSAVTYVAFGVDLDLFYHNKPGIALHWIAADLRVSNSSSPYSGYPLALVNTTSSGAAYVSPAPLAGTGVHRYLFLLFQQPANFSINSTYFNTGGVTPRLFFDLEGFVRVHKLGPPLAANYFLLGSSNSTASANATTGASGTVSATITSFASAGTTSFVSASTSATDVTTDLISTAIITGAPSATSSVATNAAPAVTNIWGWGAGALVGGALAVAAI